MGILENPKLNGRNAPIETKEELLEVEETLETSEEEIDDIGDDVTTNEEGLKRFYDKKSLQKANYFNNGQRFTEEINMVQKVLIAHYALSSKFEDDGFSLKSNFKIDTNGCGDVEMASSDLDSGAIGRLNRNLIFSYQDDYYNMNLKTWTDSSGRTRNSVLMFTNNKTSKEETDKRNLNDIFRLIKKNSMRHSVFQGKLLEYVMSDGRFQSLNVVNVKHNTVVSLNEAQERYIKHSIKRLKRGAGNLRILFNGVPGSGKTESIRNIVAEILPEYTCVIPKFENLSELKEILEEAKVFGKVVILLDDIDLYLGSRNNHTQTGIMGEFLSFFDGIKKNNISIIASTNDKKLVDSAAERPGRFNFIVDFDYLTKEQIKEVINIHFDDKFKDPKVFEYFDKNRQINGVEMKITGAFLANLAENLSEIEKDQEGWTVEDTIQLIEDSYKGFYNSQTKKTNKMSFI